MSKHKKPVNPLWIAHHTGARVYNANCAFCCEYPFSSHCMPTHEDMEIARENTRKRYSGHSLEDQV